MKVLVIYAQDILDKEVEVIGVTDTLEKAEKLIKEHFDNFKVITKYDPEEEFEEPALLIESSDHDQIFINLEWFEVK